MGATKDIGMEVTRDELHGTPEHDELTRWIAKKENYEKIAKIIQFYLGLGVEKVNGQKQTEICRDMFSEVKKTCEKKPQKEVFYSIELEKPIYRGKFLVGVLDAVIKITEKETVQKLDKSYNEVKGETENYYHISELPVEIKPRILKLGDTLRQIKIYNDALWEIESNREVDINSKYLYFLENFIILTKNKLSEDDKNLFFEQGVIPLSKEELI